MQSVRSFKFSAAFKTTAALAMALVATNVMAASSSIRDTRKPVILDSQSGINDGQSGTVLQTAPLSREPIVSARPIATPTELAPDSSVPVVVAPYIQYPGGAATTPQPQPQPQYRPVIRSQ